MPKYNVTVCFTTWSYYHVEVDAPDEDSIDEDDMIDLASEIDVPDKVDSGGGEVTDIELIEDTSTTTTVVTNKDKLP